MNSKKMEGQFLWDKPHKNSSYWMIGAACNGDPDAATACQRIGWLAN